MPTPPKYYPSLSSVVTLEDFPEYLGFIKEGIQSIFDKIYIKDFQAHISPRGESGFYGLSIVSKRRLQFQIPGTELYLVLNPDSTDTTISSFPVTVEYQWLVLAYLRNFDLNNFSFSARDFYELGLDVLNVSEEQVLQLIINKFVTPANPSLSSLQQFVNDINAKLSLNIPIPTSDNKLKELVLSIQEQSIDPASIVSFLTYLVDETDLQSSLNNVKSFFKALIPEDIDAYIKNLITPKARVTLALSAAIEFPTSILKPVNESGGPYDPAHPELKTQFKFAQALLYADTQQGFGYQMELGGSLVPQFAAIGKTGMILQVDSLKLDLSKSSNIAEADADGRPVDFVGIYARAISVALPSRWFHDGALPNSQSTTLRVAGYDILIGTGGISGTFVLETIPVINLGGTPYYFDNEIDFDYTSLVLIQKDPLTNQYVEVRVNDLPALKQKLFPNVTPPAVIPPYSFKFPLKLTEHQTGIPKEFTNVKDYQAYLNTFPNDNPEDSVPTLWKRIGGEDGFEIGLNKFDISLHQGVVTESNIVGRLKIPKLTDSDGNDAELIVNGHLNQDGDFNLTASEPEGIPFNLFDVLKITLQSVELGKENDNFYIGADTKIGFPPGSFAASIFDGKEIDLPALRFYSNGKFEIAGGTSFIPTNFTLNIGPVAMSVTGIHLGNIQREHGGRMRTYNYIGFDGGMKISPIGLDIRGEGMKYYYTSDCDDDPLNTPDSYVFISTLEIDLIIPGNVSPTEATAIIKGSITIPEPGVSHEYRGKVSLQLPKPNISGEARLRLNPNDPSFLVEAEVHPPAPIPLGPIGINSFRGLLGLRYVAEKRAIQMDDESSWYDYYMAPERGIHVEKFSGPELTKDYDNPFSVGLGAAFSSMEGGGRIASLRAMVLLSVPSLFCIDAGLTLLSERLGLAEDDTTSPPFYAFVIIANNSLEFGASAQFKLNKSKGYFLDIKAQIKAGFFFKNQKPWYVNFGTPDKPVTAKLFKDVLNVNAQAYLMISAAGIAAGANATFKFDFIIAKFKASVEVGGFISFERAQVGGYTILKGEIRIKFGPFKLNIKITVHLTVEMPKPFLIYAQFTIKVCARFAFVKVCVPAKFTLKWKKNNDIAKDPIPALTYPASATTAIDFPKYDQTRNFVKGVNMLTYEEFGLTFFGVNGGIPNPEAIEAIIPLDTFIDIKVEKGLNPTPLDGKIGGHTGAAKNNIDLIPPKRVLKNKSIRQLKHKYSIESLEIWAWKEPTASELGSWVTYHPFEAIVPDDNPANINPGSLRIGFWQRNGKQYDTLRILATNPFSFLDGAEPGWFIPEEYGITPSELFCTSSEEEWHCANVLNVPLNTNYTLGSQFIDFNFSFNIEDALFVLGGFNLGDVAQENGFGDLIVQDVANPHNFAQSLVFRNSERLVITLPEPSVNVNLKITTNSQGVTIKYWRMGINDDSIFPAYDLIETVYKTAAELQSQVEFNNEINYDPSRNVVKIEIIPDFPNAQDIYDLETQIEEMLVGNAEEAEDGTYGSFMSPADQIIYNQLVAQLDALKSVGCSNVQGAPCNPDELLCQLAEDLQDMYNHCFKVYELETIMDYATEVKCFQDFMGKIETFNSDHPDYHLIPDHLSSLVSTYNTQLSHLITYTQQGGQNQEALLVYNDFRNTALHLIEEIIELGDCNCDGDCDKDELLCGLYDILKSKYNECFSAFSLEHIYDYCPEITCFKDFYLAIKQFDAQHPQYSLINQHIHTENTALITQLNSLSDWCTHNVDHEQAFEVYNSFRENAIAIINIIEEMGHCNCGGGNSPCQKDEFLCAFYNILQGISIDCLVPLTLETIHEYCEEMHCLSEFVGRIKDFNSINPQYNLIDGHMPVQYDNLDYYRNLLANNCESNQLDAQDLLTLYNNFLANVQQTLTIIAQMGNCNCTDGTGSTLNCTTSFQQVCWKTLEHFEYSETIPSQEAVEEDMNAMINGINVTAQPIWRPNTKYYIKFRLKDLVDNGMRPSGNFDYYYGFKTVGPVGHFHKYPGAYPIPPTIDIDGVTVKQIPEEFPLTAISKYIDYERSYPNADGNLILAKPLFYGYKQCKIDIFFAKPFAYHMVNPWREYHGLKELACTMHLAIKDPISGSIIPYPLTSETVLDDYVPTTILDGTGWTSDQDPRMPHNIQMLNSFVNSVNANPDSIECTIHFGNPIKPASYVYSVTYDNLNPRKLYTALVYNAFAVNNNNEELVNEKIHEFVFQTSRYKDFREQITSFMLKEYNEQNEVIAEKDAVYELKLPLTQQQIDNAYALVTGGSTTDTAAIETQFYHPFDRVLEGVFGINPIDPPTTTDFINIINSETGLTAAVIIRNPEPFNNPRIPLQQILDTIVFYPKKPSSPGLPLLPDTHYKVLFSKDYSQIIVMHDTKKISAAFLYIVFKYKIWNGSIYVVPNEDELEQDQRNYNIKTTVRIK